MEYTTPAPPKCSTLAEPVYLLFMNITYFRTEALKTLEIHPHNTITYRDQHHRENVADIRLHPAVDAEYAGGTFVSLFLEAGKAPAEQYISQHENSAKAHT